MGQSFHEGGIRGVEFLHSKNSEANRIAVCPDTATMVFTRVCGGHKNFDGGKDRKEITMKKRHGIVLGVMVIAMTNVFIFAQDEGGGKASLTLDFGASALSVNNDGDVDSFTDAGFGEDNESTLGFSYEREFFGGVASLGFGPQTVGFTDSELAEIMNERLFFIDELYVWGKPFGPNFKFTAGFFENTDGIGDYTDDIDNFGMGVFLVGQGGAAFTEPELTANVALTNGFLSEAVFGPITAQLLLGPNFNTKGASKFYTSYAGLPATFEASSRYFNIGGRIIADLSMGTLSLLFKDLCMPMSVFDTAVSMVIDALNAAGGTYTWTPYAGTAINFTTFGAYADIAVIKNFALSLGYTGYMTLSDADDVDNILWNGIDLRAKWTGIPGLSISAHNNISFTKGTAKEWVGWMRGDDSYFFSLYNAIGLTKELTEKFSLNAEIGNIIAKMKADRSPEASIMYGTGEVDHDTFWGQVKFITSITEDFEFTVGLRFEGTKEGDKDLMSVFSVPIGITASF